MWYLCSALYHMDSKFSYTQFAPAEEKRIVLILSPHHLLNMKGDNEPVSHFLSVYIPFLRKAGVDGESLKSFAILVINIGARLFSGEQE